MTPGQTVAFYTLGCKLNFSETSTLSRQFEQAGFAKVSFEESADFYVINTCSVTDHADKKCKTLVRKAKKSNPSSKVIVTGCYAQLKPEEILNIPGVHLVIGAQEKFNILEHLDTSEDMAGFVRDEIKNVKKFHPSYSIGDRTRSFLKVQDGCDYFCSFCTIPLARGTSRNASIADTVETAKEIAKQNIREIVLTGVNIGDYGKSTGETFYDLIQALEQVEGIERFRISSIEPNLLSEEIIAFVAQSKKFVPHFHIPLQSGSDALLQSMRRRYDTALYQNRIEAIRQQMPLACIGVDVIVGYPGETDEEFEKTQKFIESLEVSYLHVFPYSERENTTAVRIKKDIVHSATRQERCKTLMRLSNQKKRTFYAQNTGLTARVLWEAKNEEGLMQGFTQNYVLVKAPYQEHLIGKSQEVVLNDFKSEDIYYLCR